MYGARYKHKSNLLTPDFCVLVGQSKYYIQISLFFQCLVFRVYQFLFLFLCSRLVSVIHSWWTPPPLPPFYKGGGGVVKISAKDGGGLDLSPEKGRVGKIKVTTYFGTNLFQCYHSPSVWCACVFFLFIYTISISVSREE